MHELPAVWCMDLWSTGLKSGDRKTVEIFSVRRLVIAGQSRVILVRETRLTGEEMVVYSAIEECRRTRAPEGRRWAETSFGGAGGLKD